jgi:hypothetical protein
MGTLLGGDGVVGWFGGELGNRRGRGITRSGDGYFGGRAEGWGGLGGEWDSGGEGRHAER